MELDCNIKDEARAGGVTGACLLHSVQRLFNLVNVLVASAAEPSSFGHWLELGLLIILDDCNNTR